MLTDEVHDIGSSVEMFEYIIKLFELVLGLGVRHLFERWIQLHQLVLM
jgi:hypothetical protein